MPLTEKEFNQQTVDREFMETVESEERQEFEDAGRAEYERDLWTYGSQQNV